MKIYPILNNLGKGKYVFIFILNERAVRRRIAVCCRPFPEAKVSSTSS